MAANSISPARARTLNRANVNPPSSSNGAPTDDTSTRLSSALSLSSWRTKNDSLSPIGSNGISSNAHQADTNGFFRPNAGSRADAYASDRRTKNLFLQSVPESLWSRLSPHLGHALMIQGQLLLDTSQCVDRIYFPNGGLVSLVVGEGEGSQVEVGVIGREGVVGAPALLSLQRTFTRAMVQVPHTCSWLPVEVLAQEFTHDRELQSLLLRHVEVLLAQASQSALCNRLHSVEERLCRWLLTIRDRIQSDEIEITHEYIGHMLGTRRSSVSIALGALQRAGFVEVGRGRITLLNVEGIGECACECYKVLRDQFATLDRK